ncbi:Eukaryotic translation initiation factor 5A [Hibiscus syriacus]|uniref:Eukaryotic translation initiation factor 5A n=1 Tax=Hibiscus syriacus TaxID=106335 RepID=A0A6A2WMM2_HIBSY|nr:Eukaryotic translation initiation factor 5A [Hibiscus syriacus]
MAVLKVGKFSTVSREDNMVVSSEDSSCSDEYELELGLSLDLGDGGSKMHQVSISGQYARILTTQDFPPLFPSSSSSSSSTSFSLSGANAAAGTERTADSVATAIGSRAATCKHLKLSISYTPTNSLAHSLTLLPLPSLLFDPCLSSSPNLLICLSLVIMCDEDHHFESKADAGASKTFPQQAGTIRKNGYIVIKGRPCKVMEVSTSKTGKHGHAKCHFVGIDIFTGKKVEDIVPSSHNCDASLLSRSLGHSIYAFCLRVSESNVDVVGSILQVPQVSLLTESGNTKDDLRLPTEEPLLTQIKCGFGEGKDLIVTVMSSMGEEQICALKDVGPK